MESFSFCTVLVSFYFRSSACQHGFYIIFSTRSCFIMLKCCLYSSRGKILGENWLVNSRSARVWRRTWNEGSNHQPNQINSNSNEKYKLRSHHPYLSISLLEKEISYSIFVWPVLQRYVLSCLSNHAKNFMFANSKVR